MWCLICKNEKVPITKKQSTFYCYIKYYVHHCLAHIMVDFVSRKLDMNMVVPETSKANFVYHRYSDFVSDDVDYQFHSMSYMSVVNYVA